MPATVDPLRQQREILTTFRRITLQRAQTEADAATRLQEEQEKAAATLATEREQAEAARAEAEQRARAERESIYAAAEERCARLLEEGEKGAAAAQKQYQGALAILGLADLRHLLTEARTVPVRLQPGHNPSQEIKRCVGEAAAAAAQIDVLVDSIMAQRAEQETRRQTRSRRLPFFIVLALFIAFLAYTGAQPCGPLRSVFGGSCGTTLRGPAGPVEAVAYSPDGRSIAAGAADGTIRLWDAANHTLRQAIRTPASAVAALAFSPDGRQLAAIDGAAIDLWDVATGQHMRHLDGDARPFALAYAPDGSLLAVARADGTVTLVATAGDAAPRTLVGGQAALRTVAFGSNGAMVAAGGDDGQVHLWETASGATIRTLTAEGGAVLALALSAQGTLAAGSASGTITLWNAGTGERLRALATGKEAVHGLVFSGDGARLFVAAGRQISVWSVAGGARLGAHDAGTAANGLALASNGRALAIAGADHTVRLRAAK
jgi:hypothetical protein